MLSIRRYVMLKQAEIGGTMFERIETTGSAADAVLHRPQIDVGLSLAELYASVDLSSAGAEDAE